MIPQLEDFLLLLYCSLSEVFIHQAGVALFDKGECFVASTFTKFKLVERLVWMKVLGLELRVVCGVPVI